jgi:hypothetical protein
MIFQRFGSKQVSNFYSKFVLTWSWRVAKTDWLVPFRLDLVWGPSDLSGCGRTRSSSTASLSDSNWIVRSRSDGHWVRERDSHRPARFPARYGQGEVDGEVLAFTRPRRRHDGMQERTASSTAWSKTSIASRREVGRRLEMQALRVITGGSFGCRIGYEKGSGSCAGTGEEG